MTELIIKDELEMCASVLTEAAKKHKKTLSKSFDGGFSVISDSSFLCEYMLFSLQTAHRKLQKYFAPVSFIPCGNEVQSRLTFLKDNGIPVSNGTSDGVLFAFCDCENTAQKEEFLKTLGSALKSGFKRCVVCAALPAIPEYPGTLTALAEREFNYYIENKCEKTEGLEYYLALEKLLCGCQQSGADIVLLRCENVLFPEKALCPSLGIENIVKEAFASKNLGITAADYSLNSSFICIRELCEKVFRAALLCEGGGIYNMQGLTLSEGEIKERLCALYPDALSVRKNIAAGEIRRRYNALSSMKLDFSLGEAGVELETGLKHFVSYLTGEPYDISENTAIYNGNIATLQQLEIEMLKEIDAICQKHGIKYFLAGGTLLGAVREGGPIPWDDDFDIGMLRGDFEKFKAVCEKELPERLCYCSPFNKSGSHYLVNKVRLKNTYFSTTYSYKNKFNDGVFVDILVYDKTSNIKPLQKLHALTLTAIYYCVILRWYNKARREYFYTASKILLPLLRLLPFPLYHYLFEAFSKAYKNKKDAKSLIDTVGKKLLDGVIPLEGLEDTVYVDFAGIEAPIPKDPVPYLLFDYGESYMQHPVYGKQICPHDFARIDLGGYVFGEKENSFRDVDLRGELFENRE